MKLLAIAVLAALVLSGCSDGGKDDDDGGESSSSTSTSRSASGTRSSSSSGTGAAAPGSIAVDLKRDTPDGAVPLAINFTLDAAFKTASGAPATKPTSVSWKVAILSGNGTNTTQGPSGTQLPAAFALNFTQAGNHTVRATVSSPGFDAANATVLVQAAGGSSGAPLFFDGAEGDASQFTISSNVWIFEIFTGTEEELDEEHPSGMWEQSADQAHTGTQSWFSHYPDNYRTRLETIAIQVPAGGATLSYWVKGGAEANGADGLHVLVNDVEVALHNAVPDWAEFSFPVPAGEAKILFRFDSDMGCSDQSPGPAGDPSGSVCGAGFDLGGLYLDDITVA